jgi:hypothetical protein
MGKLKDNYNKIKPTLRQNKQNKKNDKDKIEINKMCEFLHLFSFQTPKST